MDGLHATLLTIALLICSAKRDPGWYPPWTAIRWVLADISELASIGPADTKGVDVAHRTLFVEGLLKQGLELLDS